MLQRIKRTVQARLELMWMNLMDDDSRRDEVFVWFDGLMGAVSGFMTVVNIFTQKGVLMWSTLLFFIACVINILLSQHGRKKLAQTLFLMEILVLCGFFCISGIPEGFSALWICFIPSFTLTMLGTKHGSQFSALGFILIVVIFWTPWGRYLLQYDYTDSFMLRFPMIYVAFYLLSMYMETIRAETQKRMLEAERKYQHLYAHDALTGIYNRYGFNEQLNRIFSDPQVEELGLLILDLDKFKNVNDSYGHAAGDVVLKFAADTIKRLSGENAVVCRWGGEEFTALLSNEKNAVSLAEQIRREIEAAEIIVGNNIIRITVSIGVCTVGERSKATIAALVKGADKCLYQAKDLGRNTVCDMRL